MKSCLIPRLHRMAVIGLSIGIVAGSLACAPVLAQRGIKSVLVVKTSQTMIGQPLVFTRTDKPEVTSSILFIEPGGETGLHLHPSSSHVFVMEGTLTLEFEGNKRYEFKTGEGYVESANTLHNARNLGADRVKLLVVTFSEQGRNNVVRPQ